MMRMGSILAGIIRARQIRQSACSSNANAFFSRGSRIPLTARHLYRAAAARAFAVHRMRGTCSQSIRPYVRDRFWRL
jgi:hypothetical protein